MALDGVSGAGTIAGRLSLPNPDPQLVTVLYELLSNAISHKLKVVVSLLIAEILVTLNKLSTSDTDVK